MEAKVNGVERFLKNLLTLLRSEACLCLGLHIIEDIHCHITTIVARRHTSLYNQIISFFYIIIFKCRSAYCMLLYCTKWKLKDWSEANATLIIRPNLATFLPYVMYVHLSHPEVQSVVWICSAGRNFNWFKSEFRTRLNGQVENFAWKIS